MRSVGILVLNGLLLTLLALQGWTTYLAHYYGYHAALGAPWWEARHFSRQWRLYAPWDGLVWAWHWGWQVPGSRSVGAMLVLSVVGLGLVVLYAARHRSAGSPPAMTGHGTAQWATRRDVKKAGLL